MAAVSQQNELQLERLATHLGPGLHFGKSISAINNRIIVRNNRWSAHGCVTLGLFGAKQIVFIIFSQGSLVVQQTFYQADSSLPASGLSHGFYYQ